MSARTSLRRSDYIIVESGWRNAQPCGQECPHSVMNLNQVTIYSEKTIETVEFFQKLGLVLIVDSLPRYARLECPDGDSTLSINISDDENAETRPVGSVPSDSITLYFECEHLDEEVSRLKSLGLDFDEDPTDRDWLWRQAYLKDPNGNKICLFYAGHNRKNPPWRLSEPTE
ncbi:MAG: VOC family protein [Pyrinomonadaceae bacterium]